MSSKVSRREGRRQAGRTHNSLTEIRPRCRTCLAPLASSPNFVGDFVDLGAGRQSSRQSFRQREPLRSPLAHIGLVANAPQSPTLYCAYGSSTVKSFLVAPLTSPDSVMPGFAPWVFQ